MVAKRVSSHTWYIFAPADKALKAHRLRRTLAPAPGVAPLVEVGHDARGHEDDRGAPGCEQRAGDGGVGEEGGEVHGVGSLVGAWVSVGGGWSIGPSRRCPSLREDVEREAGPVGATGVADLGHLDEGAQREVANLGQVLLDQRQRVGLDLLRQLGLEVGVGDQVRHALQLLLGVHGQVDAERAGADGLVEVRQRVVADEDHPTLEFERGGEVGALDLGLPADHALGVAVERGLQQVDGGRVLQDAVAVIKDDDPILVFEHGAVQRVRRAVALDHHVLLGGRDVHRLGLEAVHEPVGGEHLGDGVGLADATLAGHDGGRGLAGGDHLGERLGEGEAVGDRPREALRDLLLGDQLHTRDVLLQQAGGALGRLGLGDHHAFEGGDILAGRAVEGDGAGGGGGGLRHGSLRGWW